MELVITLWIVGVLMAVAVPTFDGARERARARLTAGAVQQEIRLAGQLAFSRGTAYTLNAGVNADSLVLTPFGGTGETVLDFTDPAFDSKIMASMLMPYTAALEFDSSGDVISSVSWDLIAGSTSATVVQETGSTDPVVTTITKTTQTQKDFVSLDIH